MHSAGLGRHSIDLVADHAGREVQLRACGTEAEEEWPPSRCRGERIRQTVDELAQDMHTRADGQAASRAAGCAYLEWFLRLFARADFL
jgi:hypothetical protein